MFSSERLKGIDVFVCVAEAGSFSAAAERLHLTASAVSKAIARLEDRLGLRLFERTTRRLALTDAGTTFYRTCSRVLGDLEESELALHAEHHQTGGRIRLDLPASYGRLHVLPVVLDFARRHTLLVPHISFSDDFVDPVSQGIDILVRIGGPDIWPETLGHRYLGAQRLVFCAAPAYLAAHGEPRDVEELAAHDCVLYGQGDGLTTPWKFPGHQPGELERRVMPTRIAIGDGEGVVQALLASHGIGQLPTWLVSRHLESGRLREVLPQLASDGLSINLAWQKRRENLPKVGALLDVLGRSLIPSGHILGN
ncbi:TPA: LysR family transcriptional regulator [Pseudomonas aeruginosa]|uniref:LysR family transcriptional regulator n=1 Tax=Pseudomonas aeruginosa TaxID=287 RepID=UPI000D64A6AD|nr:LysR family transcriptional regulator [Pseudomonas aeruginosa]EJB8403869.1 LysR family transcriptional regulator [Pseudomonas aeruginosa]EKJ6829829.1 LysR family transcriptional regulator [Pseudomonas aeruginosa]MBH4020840.1 LysR family transcriptional regulator [Pseudomonas aeruginosa]MBX5550340.1 LysR family transcriptional regulator [Pseudomonas aeruginosa]MBX5725572.1 LysR family transcriptional regulator [Pseudomonas aeruginosa]